MMTLKQLMESTVHSSPDGKHWEPAIPYMKHTLHWPITDGEWHVMDASSRFGFYSGRSNDVAPAPLTHKAYMINVAPDKNGYSTGRYVNIDGWSERILDFIAEAESERHVVG